MVQIRKPTLKDDPQQDKFSKVTSCILELLDGKHAGKHINVVSVHMYMWGYNLAKANLNSTIKIGDHCEVEYKIHPKNEKTADFVDELLVVKNMWIGKKHLGLVQNTREKQPVLDRVLP